jgi:hypothetical protein
VAKEPFVDSQAEGVFQKESGKWSGVGFLGLASTPPPTAKRNPDPFGAGDFPIRMPIRHPFLSPRRFNFTLPQAERLYLPITCFNSRAFRRDCLPIRQTICLFCVTSIFSAFASLISVNLNRTFSFLFKRLSARYWHRIQGFLHQRPALSDQPTYQRSTIIN